MEPWMEPWVLGGAWLLAVGLCVRTLIRARS